MFSWENIWVIAKPAHREDILDYIPELQDNHIISEPCPRGTAAAIAWAVTVIEKTASPDAVAVLPSDHVIEDREKFRQALAAGLSHAAEHSVIVTFGIRPDRAETAYGYVQVGGKIDTGTDFPCYDVLRFHEKPLRKTAEKYIDKGTFYWNSGIFAFAPQTLFKALDGCMPEAWKSLNDLMHNRSAYDFSFIESQYSRMPCDSIDKGLLERIPGICQYHEVKLVLFPFDFCWYDMGVWETYYELSRKDEARNAVSGSALAVDCRNSLIMGHEGTLVAALDLEGMAVIAHGDAVLVCPRDRLDEVGELVKELKKRGFKSYL
jgi:mannose-1-phosphate guanylyltransferase/mannose-6-phosphate isomerase